MVQATGIISTELQERQIQKCYDETLSLLIRARDYLLDYEVVSKKDINPSLCMLHSVESFRVTARLTQVMGCLMAHRAFRNGDITEAEFHDEFFRIGGKEVCSFSDSDVISLLPPQLQTMLARSLSLYLRFARFDDMCHLEGQTDDTENLPAPSLAAIQSHASQAETRRVHS